MNKKGVKTLLFILFLTTQIIAQSSRIIPIDQPEYIYIEILQKHGFLLELNPTLWPISVQQLENAIQNVDHNRLLPFHKDVISRLNKSFSALIDNRGLESHTQFNVSDRHNTSERLEPIRPLGDNYNWQPNVALRFTMGNNSWAAQTGITFDRFYDTDPDGIDVVRRLYTRAEETYLNYQSNFMSIRLGRVSEHWGHLSSKGAILLSKNPRSFDHIRFHFGNNKLSITSIIGELDMQGAQGFYERERFIQGGVRRYVALHRLDYRPRDNFLITLYEGVLYSGASAGLSLSYLNPVQPFIFESDNDPKNYENNLQVGMGVWWQLKSWTLTGNIMLDDGSYENRSQLIASRQLEPSSWSSNIEIYRASITNSVDAFFKVDAVSSLAYRTDQREGQWTYAQRGLAYNFSDFIELETGIKWFFVRQSHNLILEPYMAYLKQGEGDLRLPLAPRNSEGFGEKSILTGLVSTTSRYAVRLNYNWGGNLNLSSDVGFNSATNENHLLGNNSKRFSGVIRLTFLMGKNAAL